MCYVQRRSSGKRARHIPPQTDPTVGLLRNMLCSSCTYVIWLVRNATRLLHLTAFLKGKGTCDGIVCKLARC